MNVWRPGIIDEIEWLEYGVSTRFLGNMSFPGNLDAHEVKRNRQKFCNELSLKSKEIVTGCQVHGDKIATVNTSCLDMALPDTDGIISNTSGIQIGVLCADCVPLIIVDLINHVIGVIHAGRKGTELIIAKKAVRIMSDCFMTNPKNCIAILGPSIGPCCYEVDLWEENARQLNEEGVLKIFNEKICTSCNKEKFFSYRAEGQCAGRMMALGSIKQ